MSGQPTYTTAYTYDALDDLTSVTQGGLSRSFIYDSLRRLTSATNPETGTITYGYDGSNNLQTKTSPRTVSGGAHLVTTMTYDGFNRILSKSYNDGSTPSVNYAYDSTSIANGLGELAQVTENSATPVMDSFAGYDSVGRVTGSSLQFGTAQPYSLSYLWNLANEMTSETYPSGRVVTTGYDQAGRPNSVSGVIGGTSTPYATLPSTPSQAYWPQGAIATLPLHNGVTETTMFNNRLQQTGMQAGSLLTLGFGYASPNNGDMVSQSIVTSGGLNLKHAYGYDAFNRICAAGEGTGAAPSISSCEVTGASNWYQNFSYDEWGDRAVSAASYLTNSDWTPNSLSQFVNNQWKRGTGDAYDPEGNQTGIASYSSPNMSSSLFTYDGENRMVTANVANEGAVSYVYDGLGRRVQKTVGTAITTYVYDASGNLATEYGGPAPAAATQYLTVDHLGSTRLVTDASGNVVRRYDYVPFGEEIASGTGGRGSDYGAASYPAQMDVVDRKFTGKERDAETGLDYFGARYYASSMGRWMSPDWSAQAEPVPYSKLDDPQTLNLNSYVRNNPLSSVDPDGHYFVVGAQDQKFYQQALTDLYRRPGGRELVNSLANSDKPVLLDRSSLDTATTGQAGVTTPLAVFGEAGVAGAHVTVGTDADLAAGAQMAPGKVSPDVTTGHELEHANDAITAGNTSLQAGVTAAAAAMLHHRLEPRTLSVAPLNLALRRSWGKRLT